MTISVIGTQTANATSVTIPAHQPGDTIVLAVFRNNNVNYPTVPSGWPVRRGQALASSSCSILLASKFASTAAETSGTWTNATQIIAHVLRGDTGLVTVGAFASTGAISVGSGGNINYPGLVLPSTAASQWVAAIAGHRSIDTDIEVAPSGMTNRTSVVGASAGELAWHDASGYTSWSSTNYTLTAGTASGYNSIVFEIIESLYKPTSFVIGG